MGKLAERLADAQRSGVYRVESTEALEEAAALNGFALERFDPGAIPGLPALLAPGDGRVLLFSGFEDLVRAAPGALDELLGRLEVVAGGCRRGGLRYFAAFLDPAALLPLAPLYNRHRKR